MLSSWVLVADNHQAYIYRFERHEKTLVLVDQINDKEGHWTRQAFIDSNLTQNTNAPVRFAQILAHSVNYGHDKHQFETLRICAPTALLDELIPLIELHVPMAENINKNFVHENPEAILEYIRAAP